MKVIVWHDANAGRMLPDSKLLIGGGTTMGIKSLTAAYALGYRSIHAFGLDSSHRFTEHHAYRQPLNDGEPVVDVTVDGRSFQASPWMLGQVKNFGMYANKLADLGCTIVIHGDGLLPWVAQRMDNGIEIENVELELVSNIEDLRVMQNIDAALALDLEELTEQPAHDRHVAIIAGGPSINDHVRSIRALADGGCDIWAINGTHDWLVSHGIKPHAMWVVDGRPECAAFVAKPQPACTYYINSRCDPAVFAALGCR